MPTAKKNVNEQIEDMNVETVSSEPKKTVKKTVVKEKPISPTDEIEVVSSVPYRVSYYDQATYDRYVWEGIGDIQSMTFDVLTRMRRNHPGYFENMEVMPTDERAIQKLNLGGLRNTTETFSSPSEYTRDNIGSTIEKIKKLGMGAKFTVVNKIKGMIENGEITDVIVLRAIERGLGIDLISLL